jgi:hypothetical protein
MARNHIVGAALQAQNAQVAGIGHLHQSFDQIKETVAVLDDLTAAFDMAAFNRSFARKIEKIQDMIKGLNYAKFGGNESNLRNGIVKVREEIETLLKGRYEFEAPSLAVKPHARNMAHAQFDNQYLRHITGIKETAGALARYLDAGREDKIGGAFAKFSQRIDSLLGLQRRGSYSREADLVRVEQLIASISDNEELRAMKAAVSNVSPPAVVTTAGEATSMLDHEAVRAAGRKIKYGAGLDDLYISSETASWVKDTAADLFKHLERHPDAWSPEAILSDDLKLAKEIYPKLVQAIDEQKWDEANQLLPKFLQVFEESAGGG